MINLQIVKHPEESPLSTSTKKLCWNSFLLLKKKFDQHSHCEKVLVPHTGGTNDTIRRKNLLRHLVCFQILTTIACVSKT